MTQRGTIQIGRGNILEPLDHGLYKYLRNNNSHYNYFHIEKIFLLHCKTKALIK